MCMKQYFLLRENKESGPFTLEAIKHKNLLTTDLVWIEGMSTSWSHAAELEELGDSVKTFRVPPKMEKLERETESRPVLKEIYHAPFKNDRHYSWLTGSKMHPLVLKEREDVKDRSFRTHRRYEFRSNSPMRPTRALWLAGLFAGMLATAFVVKKLVDTFDDTKQETIAEFNNSETGMETTVIFPSL